LEFQLFLVQQFLQLVLVLGLLSLSAIGAVVFVIVKYAVVRPIQTYIDLRTHQIQPGTNGGKSLSDVALG